MDTKLTYEIKSMLQHFLMTSFANFKTRYICKIVNTLVNDLALVLFDFEFDPRERILIQTDVKLLTSAQKCILSVFFLVDLLLWQ